MTPSEEKKPLPTSKKPAASSQLTDFNHWKVSLLEVKILYYRRQWKECINRCQQLTQDFEENVSIRMIASLVY